MERKMTETVEKPISHTMNLNFNPRYYAEDQMQTSHFMETFKGAKEEPTDKVYFRKKDEMVNYAECAFKSQIIMRGNPGFNPPSVKK